MRQVQMAVGFVLALLCASNALAADPEPGGTDLDAGCEVPFGSVVVPSLVPMEE
jgi:hypothetical protein